MSAKATSATVIGWDHSQHYAMVAAWWDGHGMEAIPEALIPCYGAIVCDSDGVPRLAGWLTADALNQHATIVWCVGNPLYDTTLALGRKLFEALIHMARELGAIVVWCQCFERGMSLACKRCGFVEVGSNATSLCLPLESW